MTDVLIENSGQGWDLVLEDGDLVLTRDRTRPVEVGQRLTYQYMTFLGESLYDTTVGVPYVETVFGDEPVPGVVGLLTNVALQTDGVDSFFQAPEFDLTDEGELNLTEYIQTGPDQFVFSLEVSP